jgi:hypothetical protein
LLKAKGTREGSRDLRQIAKNRRNANSQNRTKYSQPEPTPSVKKNKKYFKNKVKKVL